MGEASKDLDKVVPPSCTVGEEHQLNCKSFAGILVSCCES